MVRSPRWLGPLALAALLVVAGCTGATPSNRSEPQAGMGKAGPDCDLPTVVPDPPSTPNASGDRTDDLQFGSTYEGNVGVLVRQLPGNETVFVREYRQSPFTVKLGRELAEGVDYHVTVYVDCEPAFRATLERGESYRLSATRDGNVSVVTHSEG